MGAGLAACSLVRRRLGGAALSQARRRAAADSRRTLWRGAGARRDRAALRSRGRQLLLLVFRAPSAGRTGTLRRGTARGGEGGRRGEYGDREANPCAGFTLSRPASPESR